MTLGGELVLAAGAAGVTVTPASVIRPDAMRALRSQVVGPVPGLARRGEDNLVWEHGPEWRHLLGVQLDDVRRGVDALLAAIAAAAGCRRLAAGVWVRQCEVCRDHGVTDAAARVRAAARVPLAAAGGQLERVYSAAGGAGRGGPVASWDFGPARGRLVLKAYPKRDGIARVELAARSRGAVLALVGGRRAPPASDGEGLVRELEAVAVAAAPFLDAGRAQLDAALVPQAEAIELHAALWPLLRLIAPPARAAGAPGRSPSSAVADCARLALLGLLGDGRWDAGGLGTRDKVLVALVEMSGDGGALEAGPARSRAFALRPRYAAAGLALYAALLPGGGAAAQDG